MGISKRARHRRLLFRGRNGGTRGKACMRCGLGTKWVLGRGQGTKGDRFASYPNPNPSAACHVTASLGFSETRGKGDQKFLTGAELDPSEQSVN
jgi:hypothetical protein